MKLKNVSVLLCVMPGLAMASTDLTTIYQQAAATNGTYLAAEQTYKAASYGVPISRAVLLPNLTLAADTAVTHISPGPAGYPNSNGYTLTLTQPLLNLGGWYSYTQAEATYRQAAVTYAQAAQSLIMTTASSYFNVLEAQDQLRYAEANQQSLAEQMTQTDAQYKVGIKALTDVESTRASYESAIATTVADQNNLNNAIVSLAVVTGQPEKDLASLKQNFPLLKPKPADMKAWVDFGLKNNLALQSAQLQSQIDKLGIRVTEMTGYVPTINVSGSYQNASGSSSTVDTPISDENARYTTKAGEVALNWNVFSGGQTYATVKQNQYTYQAGVANQTQTSRQTDTNVSQAYLNVLSDISQIQAYGQAVISGQVSLRAMKAGYLVGTRTIVDVLTQQSNLFSSQQLYAQAIYNYINDTLNLKEQAGLLGPQDITAVNAWLVPAQATPVATHSAS
ncbi:MAG: TolC family outer membrane protein [Gammaproteobacteria bacterium]|nr:TolC family outer membrane protein [Gammaproteobacteria bacterium]